MENPKRFPFTEARIRDLGAPAGGRLRLYDEKRPGLLLCVTATGAKSFRFLRKVNGRTVELGIGSFPRVTVEAARKAVEEFTASYVKGEDPAAERRALRAENTLAELWTWFEKHHIAHLRASTGKRYGDSWRLHIEPELGSRRLSAIGKSEVQRLSDAIATASGPGAGRHVCAVLSAMYHAAAKDEALAYKGAIPTQGIRRPRVPSRARFLQPGELPRFLAALSEEPELWRVFWTCCLFVGLRRGNVASSPWKDLSLETGHWTVPEERSKTGAFLTVPITGAPLEMLRNWKRSLPRLLAEVNDRRAKLLDRGDAGVRERLPLLTADELNEAGLYLFPAVLASDKPSAHPHVTDPKGSWRRILIRAQLIDLRPHDLRRSIGSWMALGGVGMNVIGAALGHKDQRSTAVYARLNDGAVRTAMERASQAMLNTNFEGNEP